MKTISLEQLVLDLQDRMSYLRADRNIHTFFLKELDAEELIVFSFGHVVKGLETKATLVDLSIKLGRRIRQKLKLKRDSIAACHTGWFILISFLETGLISYELNHQKTKRGKTSKFMTYNLRVKDKDSLFAIWDSLSQDANVDLFPVPTPPEPWTSGVHSTGINIVKKSSFEVIKLFSPENQPIVFKVLNKLGATPWLINQPVLNVYNHYFDSKEESPFKFHNEANREKRESFFIEAKAIRSIAERQKDNVFYHLYNADFR